MAAEVKSTRDGVRGAGFVRARTAVDPAIVGLVELCEAQQATIGVLETALGEHQRAGTPRAALEGLAHQVAGPLTAITGMLQLVASDRLPPDRAAEFVHRAFQQSQHLVRIVDELVTSAGGAVQVSRARFATVRLADLVADAMEAAWPGLNGRRVEVDVPSAVSISTVPARVRLLLVNVLSNAGRHSPAGTAVRVAGRVDRHCAVLEVADRGPGLAWERADELFLPFHRGRGRRGTHGLGLYVVRRLAESLHGSAGLFPREGGGTVARIVLPQRRPGDTAEP